MTTRGLPLADRLALRLRPEGDCLVFTGTRSRQGYGSLRVAGAMIKAHRVAWELAHGQIPAGMAVCHRCDNPPCCNVAHLFLGTIADNNADRHAKGRTVMPTNGPDHLRIRTHCPQGHPYSGDNLRIRPGGGRRCAQCYRERARAYSTANRAVVNQRKRLARANQRTAV